MNRVLGFQSFHMDTRGWEDIAYNFLIGKLDLNPSAQVYVFQQQFYFQFTLMFQVAMEIFMKGAVGTDRVHTPRGTTSDALVSHSLEHSARLNRQSAN